MRHLLVKDSETDAMNVVDVPEYVPSYALGTYVYATVPDGPDTKKNIEGTIIYIDIRAWFNKDTDEVESEIVYGVETEERNHFDVYEDEVNEYLPESNELEQPSSGPSEEDYEEKD